MERVNRVCVCGTEIHWNSRSSQRTCGKRSCQRLLRNKTRRPNQTAVEAPLLDDAPGTEAWCREHGISPAVWAARGVYRYGTHEQERVKELFAEFAIPPATVSKIVRQSGGLVMPKHAPPGYPSIPPQLRPDSDVITDSRKRWHSHPSELKAWPVYPVEAGRRAGKRLPKFLVLQDEDAAPHLRKDKGGDYSPLTGFGCHRGLNRGDVHFHIDKAKYTLLGAGLCKRIDLHPWALERIRAADRVFFVIEGTPKNDAVLSAGEAVFSVPSVNVWDPKELTRFASEYLAGKCVFIVPDADWYANPLVKRQAFFIRTVLRGVGVESEVAAPPYDLWASDNSLKGVDDYLGSGRTIDGLKVLQREAPEQEIAAWVLSSDLTDPRLRSRAIRALRGMSLHSDPDGAVFTPMTTLARIMFGTNRKRAVVDTLHDLTGAIDVVGSLDTKIEEWDGRKIMDWVTRPQLVVRPEFRSTENIDQTLGEFWMNYQAVRNGVIVDRKQLDRIEATVRDMSDRLYWGRGEEASPVTRPSTHRFRYRKRNGCMNK